MGNIKLTDFNGGNGYSAVITPAFDIDAANVSLNRKVTVASDILSPRNKYVFGK
jgi:hypothetical protein